MAPHVLASAVLTAIAVGVPPKIETAPNPYESAAVKAAIDELCQKAVKDYNRDFPKSPVTDERCGYKMSAARANADRSVEALHTPEARQAWARRICPSPQKRSDNSVACGADLERPIGADARFGYMLTAASIVETKPGSKFAAFLGEALGAAKDDLTKAISQQIVPAQRKAADEAEGSASRAARRGLALADLGVTKAEQALAELQAETPAPAQSKVTAARAELMQAKIAANDAYRLAGLAAPFPELD